MINDISNGAVSSITFFMKKLRRVHNSEIKAAFYFIVASSRLNMTKTYLLCRY